MQVPRPPDARGFIHRLRVRYHEVDLQGHVYHSRYLDYVDVAFTEFLRDALSMSYTEMIERGCDPALVQTQIQFLGPAHLDQVLSIGVSVARVGTSSFVFRYEVERDDGRETLRATTTYVNFDADTGSARPLPDFVRGPLTALAAEDGECS